MKLNYKIFAIIAIAILEVIFSQEVNAKEYVYDNGTGYSTRINISGSKSPSELVYNPGDSIAVSVSYDRYIPCETAESCNNIYLSAWSIINSSAKELYYQNTNSLPISGSSSAIAQNAPGTYNIRISICDRVLNEGHYSAPCQSTDGINFSTDGTWAGPVTVYNIPYTVIPPPTCTLSYSPSGPLTAPGSTTVSWTSTDATSGTYSCTGPVTASGDMNAAVGSFPVSGIGSGTETCTINASGPGGTTSCSRSIVINSPASCNLPWGGTIASGTNVSAYQLSSVACGSTCAAPQTRTCTNGTLSGTYTNQSCSVAACPTGSIYWNLDSLTAPGSATLTWSTSGATSATYSCTGPNPTASPVPVTPNLGGSTPVPFNGSLTGVENCTLTVNGSGGPVYYSDTININPPATTTGVCGSATTTGPLSSPPTTNLCSVGSPSAVTSNATSYLWTCTGTNNTPVGCSVARDCGIAQAPFSCVYSSCSTCGTNSTGTCSGINTCGATVVADPSNCNSGSGCPAVACPACPPERNANWREVSPN